MIWLIGCNGMLGNEIARQLKENNIEYTGTDREVDFTDSRATAAFVEGKKIDYIINCAAYTAVDKAESDVELAEKLNVDGPANIAKLAKKIGAKLIHISTDYVFDGTSSVPLTEDMAVKPIGVYGVTKARGEKAVSSNTDEFYILRTAWLYGWAGRNFVYTMIKAMNTHSAVKVVNDQKGTPTFAFDLANVILTIIKRNKEAEAENKEVVPYGIYHCTDLGEITWWDFTKEIQKQTVEIVNSGENPALSIPTSSFLLPDCVVNACTTDEYPTPAKRPAYSVLCKDKIQKTLGIQLPDWKESLNKFLTSPFFDKTRIE